MEVLPPPQRASISLAARKLLPIILLSSLHSLSQANCIGSIGVYDIRINDDSAYSSDIEIDCVTPGTITLGSGTISTVTVPQGAVMDLIAPTVSIVSNSGVAAGGELHIMTAEQPLNDTGTTQCADDDESSLSCPVTGFSEQDAQFGRDISYGADDQDGYAGYSFTKLNGNGFAVDVNEANWSCIKDNVTGLIWEVKTDDDTLHDKDNEYSWYDPAIHEGDGGTPNYASNCIGSNCDTSSFIAAINTADFCGANDWRMPTVAEIRSILKREGHASDEPMIDQMFFPFTKNTIYWTRLPKVGNENYSRSIDFGEGDEGHSVTRTGWYVRAVRGWN